MWRNKDGQKYIGEWRGNKANGYGIYITRASRYQGIQYSIKVISASLSSREKDSSNLKMEMRIEAAMRMECRMDLDSIIGKMGKLIVESSPRGFVTVGENGEIKRVIITKVSSQKIKKMAKGSFTGRMETFIKVNS